jgi:hypothetical protein
MIVEAGKIMATLHGIFAELGIERPVMHPEREILHDTPWTVDQHFDPLEGESYELTYRDVPFGIGERRVIRKVRIDGPMPDAWFDLEAGTMLDRELQALPVREYRLLK